MRGSRSHYTRKEDGRPVDSVGPKRLYRRSAVVQRERRYVGANTLFGGECQEVHRIAARHVGHATDLSFAPQQMVIVELGHTVQMDGIDGDDAALSQRRQRRYDDVTRWSKGNCAIELAGRFF